MGYGRINDGAKFDIPLGAYVQLGIEGLHDNFIEWRLGARSDIASGIDFRIALFNQEPASYIAARIDTEIPSAEGASLSQEVSPCVNGEIAARHCNNTLCRRLPEYQFRI